MHFKISAKTKVEKKENRKVAQSAQIHKTKSWKANFEKKNIYISTRDRKDDQQVQD